MKATLNSSPKQRKIVAVLGAAGGIFLPNAYGRSSSLLTQDGEVSAADYQPLEQLVCDDKKRTPVFEGDTITLQF